MANSITQGRKNDKQISKITKIINFGNVMIVRRDESWFNKLD